MSLRPWTGAWSARTLRRPRSPPTREWWRRARCSWPCPVSGPTAFGSWGATIEASAEPVEALSPAGVAVLFADDPVVAKYRDRTAGRVVTFGLSEAADIRGIDVRLAADGCAGFTVMSGSEAADVR